YAFDGNNWVKEEGVYSSQLQTIDLREDDLLEIEFTKASGQVNTLVAKVKDSSLKAIFGNDFEGVNCVVEIVLNQNEKITSLKLTYQTVTGKSVEIATNYSYNFVEVELPAVENDA
ncbi:MAG: hypothetical protein ACI4TX_02755, partial [Christensenellales bacterium]